MFFTPSPTAIPSAYGIEDIEFPSFSAQPSEASTRTNRVVAHGIRRLEVIEEESRESVGGALGIGFQRDPGPPPEVEREALVWNRNSSDTVLQMPVLETDPLIHLPVAANAELLPMSPTYGALFAGTNDGDPRGKSGSPFQWKRKTVKPPKPSVARRAGKHANGQGLEESEYLRSKLWWFGFLLMNVGETGNFISYAFAPASVVAPLGTFALIANCLFAPLLLHERLRKRDLFGVLLAIIGAVTVVLSSNMSDTRLSPEKLLEAISQRAFLVFSAIYIVSASILMGFSEGSAGRGWVLVDVGLCALFGGFTVLSTKAVSTLLTTRGLEMFQEWMTYPVLAVLIGTGIGQIRYLNRALMRFDSKVVIPTQFVLFNLSAIIGSAVLYGDFRTVKFHQFVTFMYGCAATFAGVWTIAWVPTPSEPALGSNDADGAISDAEGEGHGLLVTDGAPTSGVGRKPGGVPVLRSRRSTLSLVGISPAQRLLLVHTPPRPEVALGQEYGVLDVEHSGRGQEGFDGSIGRRRAISWLNESSPTRHLGSRIRERGSVERR
ncbi:magnesium transporter NIPA-domain-containing protein [Multifurca ochricompacta]|uniref:Magnesium transporter NIPA-domain-containing protein n=1 Tax=Multifurca ochricompacta TaxID=376703 RepID=A0AAD4MBD9_9AGAM|nr:magnesium transporter NIPA-domain-containing protein [Multifurca ochricompacta]